MEERRQHILFAVIQEYAKNPVPVGSNTLVENYQLSCSTATVRAELASLEEQGYLLKAHTSSGRIPSHLAYRYFVDTLIAAESYKGSRRDALGALVSDFASSEDLLSAVGHALSQVTSYLALISNAGEAQGFIRRIELIFVHSQQAILVVMTNDEQVQNRMLSFDAPVTLELTQALSADLDKALRACGYAEVLRLKEQGFQANVSSDLSLEDLGRLSVLAQHDPLVIQALLAEVAKLLQGLEKPQSTLVHGGLSALLKYPEFHDIERMRPLVNRIEKGFDLLELIPASSDSLVVTIGEENVLDELGQVSIVASPYRSAQGMGFVGVLGPVRMNYVKTIYAVSSAASELSARIHE